MSISLELSAHERRVFTTMAGDLTRVFGDRLISVVAYTRTRSAAFTRSLAAADLEALSVLADAWRRSGLETPLLLTVDEFERSLDAFPIEYQAIIDRHVVITGTPPFAGVRVATEQLRRACEAQAKGHLIHLRQGWVDAGGHRDELSRRLVASALPLHVLLSHVANLTGRSKEDPETFAATQFGPDAEILRAILALEEHPEGAPALVHRLSDYLAACERVWAFVDGWRA